MLKSKTRKWTPFSLILFSFFLIAIVARGSGEAEERNSDESTMMLELVHRDDPRVAGNGIKKSGVERFKELVQRDISRYQKISRRLGRAGGRSRGRKDYETFEMPMHAGRDSGIGQYLVEVRVGTPGQKFWLIADTGSDLTWFNCRYNFGNGGGRRNGGRQPRTSFAGRKRVFVAGRSRSFQTVPCSSKFCNTELAPLFSLSICPNPSNPCRYDYSYEDGSHAKGLFGHDVITVGLTNGRKAKLQNLLIGCTRSIIDGATLKEDGVLGLGIAKDTFVEKAASQYGGKFSYCLVDHLSHKNVSSYLTFGDYNKSKTKLLSEIQHTELLVITPFYAAHLVAISIGDQILHLPPEIFDLKLNNGIAVFDSGSSLTTFARPAYDAIIDVLTKYLDKYQRSAEIEPFKYCYKASEFDMNLVPRLVFHFAGGAQFEPPVKSYVIDVKFDVEPQVKCIGILSGLTLADLPGNFVIGSIMQQNHLWEFDLFNNILRFAPSACL